MFIKVYHDEEVRFINLDKVHQIRLDDPENGIFFIHFSGKDRNDDYEIIVNIPPEELNKVAGRVVAPEEYVNNEVKTTYYIINENKNKEN
jgi:hypothetical protein